MKAVMGLVEQNRQAIIFFEFKNTIPQALNIGRYPQTPVMRVSKISCCVPPMLTACAALQFDDVIGFNNLNRLRPADKKLDGIIVETTGMHTYTTRAILIFI